MHPFKKVATHFVHRTAEIVMGNLDFFNFVMAAVSLSQAMRLWAPDDAFATPGYQVLRDHVSENAFALLPFMHFVGSAFRQYAKDFYFGERWFWRVGQVTHVIGAVVFAVPAWSISTSIHTVGLQSLGFFIIAAAMVWQVFRTDV